MNLLVKLLNIKTLLPEGYDSELMEIPAEMIADIAKLGEEGYMEVGYKKVKFFNPVFGGGYWDIREVVADAKFTELSELLIKSVRDTWNTGKENINYLGDLGFTRFLLDGYDIKNTELVPGLGALAYIITIEKAGKSSFVGWYSENGDYWLTEESKEKEEILHNLVKRQFV